MSLSPNEKYPGRVAVDPNYQDGKFKDSSPSTANNGSPLKALDRNEQLALQEAVMDAAGFEYNGTPDTPQNSQMFKAYKASLSNGANLLSNHNFIIPSPDDSQPAPSATPTSYPAGYEIFSGVFANETTGITNLTYIDGRVSFSGGDFYMAVPNAGALENITEFVASVADFDGKPRTRGVSYSLVGDEYRVTVGVDALEDAGATLTPLGSVKFEQGSVATGHEVGANAKEQAHAGDSQEAGGNLWPVDRTQSADLNPNQIPAGTVGISFIGGDFTELTQFVIRKKDGTDTPISGGGQSNLVLSGGVIGMTIGTEDVYLINKKYWDLSSTYLHAKAFHTTGGGADDTDRIVAWLDFCDKIDRIPFSDDQHECISPMVLSRGIVGVKGVTKFIFPEGFENTESDTRGLFAIYNKNYSLIYDENTADEFDIQNVEFEMQMLDSDTGINGIIGLANTKGVNIFDTKVSSSDLVAVKPGARTCITLFGANKNTNIFRNEVHNENTRAGGGCIWVQGKSGLTLDDGQATENIRIYNNDIYQTRPDDGDESVALWGAGGVLKNVRSHNNSYYLNGGGQGATAFNTASSITTTGLIDDIKYHHETFYTNLKFNVIRLGGSRLSEGITNLEVSDCRIYCETTNTSDSYVIRVVETGGDVEVNRNHIENVGSVNFTRGIAGFGDFTNKTFVDGNTIKGGFDSCLSFVYSATNNKVLGGDRGFDECVKCNGNIFRDIKVYVAEFRGSENYDFMNNVGTMAAGALYAVRSSVGSTGPTNVKSNSITTNDVSTQAILLQGSGKQRVQINTFYGAGSQPAFANLVLTTDNDYYGTIA